MTLKTLCFALAITLAPVPFASAEKPVAPKAAVAVPIVTAKVNGLVCDFCAQSVRKVFSKEAAVSAVNVDLDKGEVKLTLHPGKAIDDARIKELIRKSGYALVAIEREGGA